MPNNKFNLILLLIFTYLIKINAYQEAVIENRNNINLSSAITLKNSKNQYSEAEKIHYENNKWDFMDKVFVTYVHNQPSKYDKYPFIAAVISGAIPTIISFLYAIKENSGQYRRKDTFREIVFWGIFLGLSSAACSATVVDLAFYSTAYYDKLKQVFSWFIKNYNPDINANMQINLKKFVPEELHKMFDAMYTEYNRLGDEYLTEQNLYLLHELSNKIVYEIKNEKYKKYYVKVE